MHFTSRADLMNELVLNGPRDEHLRCDVILSMQKMVVSCCVWRHWERYRVCCMALTAPDVAILQAKCGPNRTKAVRLYQHVTMGATIYIYIWLVKMPGRGRITSVEIVILVRNLLKLSERACHSRLVRSRSSHLVTVSQHLSCSEPKH